MSFEEEETRISSSVNRLGDFLKTLGDNLFYKIALKIANFLGYFVNVHSYVKTIVATFLGIIETFGLLFTPTSGHIKLESK